MAETITIALKELHCEAQSEAGGCEPYLFTSFYAVASDGTVKVTSPAHEDVRGAFANDVEAGHTLPVPQEIGTATLPADGSTGLVALVIDEDLSRDVAVQKAHAAFHARVETHLREGGGRVDAEALRQQLLSDVRRAVASTYDLMDTRRDQDDHLAIGVHEVSGRGAFELPLGEEEDRFILRGEVH